MKARVLDAKQLLMMTVSVIIGTLFVVAFVEASTTITTNIATGGTLGVEGLSTLAGFQSTASSSVSAAFRVTGLETQVAGFVSQSSSTVAAAFTTNGATRFESTVNASSTLQATGDVRFYGDGIVDGGTLTLTHTNAATSTLVVGCIQMYATSTASPGKLTLVSNLGTASTTGANGLYFIPVWTFGTCP